MDDVLRHHKIPAEFSKDGQEHLANNKKEFFQYFKKDLNQSNDTTEFSLLRRLYEVQNYVVSRRFWSVLRGSGPYQLSILKMGRFMSFKMMKNSSNIWI